MFRSHTLLVLALLLAVVTASAIIPSTGLELSKRELDTAIRYGSYRSSGGRDEGISSERGNVDRGIDRDVKSRGGPRGENDDMGPRTPGNRKERDNSDEAENPRGKVPKRGNRLGQGSGLGTIGKCNPLDPDCRTSEKNENPETMPPGIPGRKDSGIRAKGPRRGSPGRGRGLDRERRPRPVRKCDPWNPGCGMDTDDEDTTARFRRGKGPQGPKRRRGGKRNIAQRPMRRGNGVRRRRGPNHGNRERNPNLNMGRNPNPNMGRNPQPNRGRNSLGNKGGKGGKRGRY